MNEPIPIFNRAAWLVFNPSVLIQYAEVNGPNVLQFNGRSRALRLGPQLQLTYYPNKTIDSGDSFIALSRLSAGVSYHWAREMVSGRPFDLFATNVSYALDPAGHLAISATYQKGRDESTGISINQILVGLTGKL